MCAGLHCNGCGKSGSIGSVLVVLIAIFGVAYLAIEFVLPGIIWILEIIVRTAATVGLLGVAIWAARWAIRELHDYRTERATQARLAEVATARAVDQDRRRAAAARLDELLDKDSEWRAYCIAPAPVRRDTDPVVLTPGPDGIYRATS
jgi:hypothetical protein